MSRDKDIKFPEKKVDSSWKEQIDKDKASASAQPVPPKAAGAQTTSREFLNFLKSLATQAMMSLGEIPNPMTGQREIDPATAKEMIDLLSVIRLKTKGNCSAEESAILENVVSELQLKFSQLA